MGGADSRRLPGAAIAALAAFAVYLALLNNFLRFHGYPLMRLEVLYVVLAGAVLGLLFGLTYHLASRLPKWPFRIVRAVLTGALVAYAVSIISFEAYVWIAGAFAAAAALVLLFDLKLFGPIALMAFITLVVATLGIGQQTDTFYHESGRRMPSVAQEPAIIHIILDEHIGTEGMARGGRSDKARRIVESFYASHGFRLFGGAYSDYYNTANSIPFVLNFGKEPAKGAFFASAVGNEYFKLLQRSGYRINVLASEYVRYCAQIVVSCISYNSAYYGKVADASLSAGDKALIIGKKMVPEVVIKAASKVYLWLYDRGYHLPVPVPSTNLNPTAITSLAAFRRFEREVTDVQPGQVYFAHILMPHMPYALRSDCSLAPIDEWRERVRSQSLAGRDDAYASQVICTTRQVAAVLKSVERTPAGRNAIIILHGDHGSRITRFEPLLENVGLFNDDDLIAGHSTLFAVRAPRIEAGYDPRHFRLVDLLRELAASGFRKTGSQPVGEPTIELVDKNMRPKRSIPLPKDW